jgi:hypothetical protein
LTQRILSSGFAVVCQAATALSSRVFTGVSHPTTGYHSKNYQINPNDPQNKPLPSSEPATMQDLTYTLDDSFVLHRPASGTSQGPAKVVGTAIPAGAGAFQIKGSDGRLEVQLARGSLDFA